VKGEGEAGRRDSGGDEVERGNMTDGNGSAHRITTVEELRRILPPPLERTKTKLLDHLDAQATAFLRACPFLLLSTAGRDGRIEVSPKGDAAGFVRIEDDRTVVIPDRPGNNLAFGLQNILERPQVGVIALLPRTGETLRFSGSAELTKDPALLEQMAARGKPALLGIRIRIERAYFHCAKAVLRSALWKPETWPAAGAVSFGRIMGERLGSDASGVEEIDAYVADGYRTRL
jgi:PPOX class probable FMN-dependent enzyme